MRKITKFYINVKKINIIVKILKNKNKPEVMHDFHFT